MPRLRLLFLNNTKVTEAAVPILKKMDLRRLDLTGTAVSPAGIKQLKETMANCEVFGGNGEQAVTPRGSQ
jgi:hypothetical protein